MKKIEILKVLISLLFKKKKSSYQNMSLSEFRNEIILIISSSNSKKEIKERIRELGYNDSFCIYYGTSPRANSVNSAKGVPVTTTLLFHPKGSFAIG